MLNENTLKLSEQGVGAIMVAMTNALIKATFADEDEIDGIDVSKVLAGYRFSINEDGNLEVLNPVLNFSVENYPQEGQNDETE
jgi:hypothetical protein